MVVQGIAPLVLKDYVVTIGADDFKKAVSKISLVPSAQTVTWSGGGGTSFSDTSAATWVANVEYMQDWDSPGSLSRYLFAHEGEKVALAFSPRNGSGPSFTAMATVVPGAVGGDLNAPATTSVTLPLDGKPVLAEAAGVPTILAATPGGAAAGALVTITGTRFTGTVAVTGVKFGAVNASAWVVVSDSTIVAVMPAGAAGAANVVVTNPAGASAAFVYNRG